MVKTHAELLLIHLCVSDLQLVLRQFQGILRHGVELKALYLLDFGVFQEEALIVPSLVTFFFILATF